MSRSRGTEILLADIFSTTVDHKVVRCRTPKLGTSDTIRRLQPTN